MQHIIRTFSEWSRRERVKTWLHVMFVALANFPFPLLMPCTWVSKKDISDQDPLCSNSSSKGLVLVKDGWNKWHYIACNKFLMKCHDCQGSLDHPSRSRQLLFWSSAWLPMVSHWACKWWFQLFCFNPFWIKLAFWRCFLSVALTTTT